jgi:hypothetical protein
MFKFINFTDIHNFFPLIKIGFLSVDFIFIFFLVIMIKQVYSMNHVVNDTKDFLVLKTGSYVIILIAISLLLTALVIL